MKRDYLPATVRESAIIEPHAPAVPVAVETTDSSAFKLCAFFVTERYCKTFVE